MKKSFMTRALAMGLSFAMAFSLSAATNVTTASAAAKKASVTTFMRASSKTVTEGKHVTAKMWDDVAKKYRIKSHTESDVAKKYISVKMLSSRKGLTITAKDGAVTAANLEKKGVNTKIYFAPAKSASAVKKAKATKYVNLKVAVKAAKQEEKPEEVVKAISSATQTGVKTVTVTTNFDATNSTVKITRNGAAVETDKIGFSEDGKTITIPTVANIVAAEYVITVDDLTATVTGEASKVDKIQILSDKAAAVKDGAGKYTKATVGYAVYNQFGDDITKTTSLTANTSAANATLSAKDHLVTFTAAATQEFIIGRDIITLVLLDSGNTGVSAQATLTVDMEAYGKEMTFEGVYNADGKTLTEDTDFDKDTFYVLFTVKDQYGMKLGSYKGVTENSDLYLSVLGGLTTLDKYSSGNTFSVITKGGEDYLAYRLKWTGSMTPIAGEATVQLLSKGGASCQGTITVAEGDRVANITFTNPAVLAGREVTEIPFSATDAAGKEVTKFKTLNKINITQPNNGAIVKFEKQSDGTAKLYLDATAVTTLESQNATSIATVTFETESKKFFHHMFTITETARPVAIDGLQGISTTIANSTKPIEIKLKNLKLEDQYGRIMSENDIKRMVKNSDSTGPKYKLAWVKAEILHETNNSGIIKMTDPTSAGSNVYKLTSTFANQDTVIATIQPNVGKKGDVTLEFTFNNGVNNINDKDNVKDSADVMFTVKDVSQVDEATVSVDTIYAASNNAAGVDTDIKKAYKKAVKVVANGAQLGANEYKVDAPTCFSVVQGDNVWEIYFNDARESVKEFKDKTADTITKQITVTLNGTGEKVTQDVTVSRVAPYTASIDLKDDQETVYVAADEFIDNAAVLAQALKEAKDQYGVKINLNTITDATFADGSAAKPVYTFTNMDDKWDTITNNGSINAKLKLSGRSDAQKSAIMEVAFGENSTATTKIKLKVAGSGNTAVATAVNAWKDAVVSSAGGVKLVQVIDKYQELNGGSKWSSLKNVDKQALVDAIWANGASVASGSAAGINEVVVKYSADAYVARKAISDTKIDSKDIATALKDAKVVSIDGITVTNVVTATAITGKAIGLSCVTISAVTAGDGVRVEATPSAVDNGKNGYVDVTYQYVVSGSAVTVVDRYKVAIVGDAYTAPSVSVSYWDYSIKNNAFIRE